MMVKFNHLIIINMLDQRKQKINELRLSLKEYENFPKPNMKFYDIFPIFSEPKKLQNLIDILAEDILAEKLEYSKIFMLQSRGFLFGVPLSLKLNKPCCPVRKKGKLPGQVCSYSYDLEYGSDTLQIQKQAIQKGDKVIIVDDILATGGTLNATIKLLQDSGAIVQKCIVISKIPSLKGDEKLLVPKQKVHSIFDL